jgi:hypothetical protein
MTNTLIEFLTEINLENIFQILLDNSIRDVAQLKDNFIQLPDFLNNSEVEKIRNHLQKRKKIQVEVEGNSNKFQKKNKDPVLSLNSKMKPSQVASVLKNQIPPKNEELFIEALEEMTFEKSNFELGHRNIPKSRHMSWVFCIRFFFEYL